MEILKMEISIAQDDMRDAEMLMGYAEDAKPIDRSAARHFLELAKERLSDFEKGHKRIAEKIEAMMPKQSAEKISEPMHPHAICWGILHKEYAKKMNALQMRIENFSA